MITTAINPTTSVDGAIAHAMYIKVGSARKSLVIQKMRKETEKRLAEKFDPNRVDILRRV